MSALRLVKQLSPTYRIMYEYEFNEYRVQVKGNPEATYFTDDKQDAFDTAKNMQFRKVH